MEKKVVLITGASGDIGKAIAIEFGKMGFRVVVGYNNNKKVADEVVKEIFDCGGEAVAFGCDVSKWQECKKLVDFSLGIYGKIDVLVCCAGVSRICPTVDYCEFDYHKIIDTNFGGTFFLTKHCLDSMLSNNRGKVIYISSVWGLKGSSCEALYCASKSAQIGLCKSLAKEFGNCGVTFNCVAPGMVDTKMNNNLTDCEKEDIVQQIPLGRMATARDVAKSTLFLASDDADYINGQVITVDGGWI